MDPYVSIIIATYNVVESLSRTIESIRNQSYENYECIVIDGASTDGTVDLLKQFGNMIDCWISEPDLGIYDAWNKGIKLARGRLICFLGADDCWAHSFSLEEMVNARVNDEDIVSAKVAVVSPKGEVIRLFGKSWTKASMEKRPVVAHPGMLVDIRLFRKYGTFDVNYAIAGDYEWLLRLDENTTAVYLNQVTVFMGCGGVSERKLQAVLSETRNAQLRHVKSAWVIREINFISYVATIAVSRVRRRVMSLFQ